MSRRPDRRGVAGRDDDLHPGVDDPQDVDSGGLLPDALLLQPDHLCDAVDRIVSFVTDVETGLHEERLRG